MQLVRLMGWLALYTIAELLERAGCRTAARF